MNIYIARETEFYRGGYEEIGKFSTLEKAQQVCDARYGRLIWRNNGLSGYLVDKQGQESCKVSIDVESVK